MSIPSEGVIIAFQEFPTDVAEDGTVVTSFQAACGPLSLNHLIVVPDSESPSLSSYR